MHVSPWFFSYVDQFLEEIHHVNCSDSSAGAMEGKKKEIAMAPKLAKWTKHNHGTGSLD